MTEETRVALYEEGGSYSAKARMSVNTQAFRVLIRMNEK